jgi:hypothetical protein
VRSPRHVVDRLIENARMFSDGARWPRHLQEAAGSNVIEPAPPSPLEQYFDRHLEGPGLWKWRHYFPIYERHLSRFVGRDIHVVEVGIYSGGSLPMWLEYFGPDAHIHGIDIEEACRVYAADRITVHIGDQADPAFWRRFLREVPRVDILLDDGGHEPHQQLATLKAVLPSISPGGVYLCEDIHGPGQPFHSFVDALGRGLHTNGRRRTPLQQHVDSIHRYPFVTVIEKPSLPVPALESQRHGTEWEPFL